MNQILTMEHYIFDYRTSTIVKSNKIAFDILKIIDEESKWDDAIRRIKKQFPDQDTNEFLESLLKVRVLVCE